MSETELEEPSLAERARVIKAGACIEASFKRGKDEVGMEAYQVRTWPGWHHHMALSLMAVWFLIGETHRGQQVTPALTLSQVRYGLSLLLLEVFYTPGVDDICRQVQRQWLRNELARFSHHRTRKCLPPRKWRREIQEVYLLRSLLVCGRCGRRMVGSWSTLGGRSICALRYPRHVPGACPGRSLGAPTIEQSVWEHVQTLLADPEVLRQQYEQGRGDPAVDVRAEHERARLERKLATLEREKMRLLDAYQAEVIALTALAERRQRLMEQGQQLRARVQEIEQQRRDQAAELRL